MEKKLKPVDVCQECGERKEGKYKFINGVRYFICNDCKEAFFS